MTNFESDIERAHRAVYNEVRSRGLIFWNRDFEYLNPTLSLNDVQYCYFPENSEELSTELCILFKDRYGFYPPNKPGYYFYREVPNTSFGVSNKFVSFNEKLKELKDGILILENKKIEMEAAIKKEER